MEIAEKTTETENAEYDAYRLSRIVGSVSQIERHRTQNGGTRVNSLPKVVTWQPGIELTAVELQVQRPDRYTTQATRFNIFMTHFFSLSLQ